MNSLIIVLGSVLLSGPSMANEQESTITAQRGTLVLNSLKNEPRAWLDHAPFGELPIRSPEKGEAATTLVPMDEIVYLEEEIEIDLGFDTADYLPVGFDPHRTNFDLNSIGYLDNELEVELGFDPKDFLPLDFNPYTDVVGLVAINFMEVEHIDLGFDTADYLPEGFSPYKAYINLDSIPEMEEEIQWELGLHSGYGLPEDFNPYTNVVAVGSISFMEPEEMDLGFDTFKYLPKGFDPYVGSKQ